MADWLGKQIGKYRLLRLLGEGGFAKVYLGEHIHLGTQAAVKLLRALLVSDEADKFRNEARNVAHLLHPNIVRVLDFDVEEGTPYLIMDYAPNGTLRQRHPKGQPVPLATVISYVKQIADALQCAHDEKLIHRDVKPENILIGRRSELLLSDFGIALIAQSTRYQGTQDMTGTIGYMSPEQLQSKPRAASDQYSLGIMVYEWLTGEKPFEGGFVEIVAQQMTALPPPMREKVPSILADVERVVMIALEKDYTKRFGSVTAFAKALEQAAPSRTENEVEPPRNSQNAPPMSVPPFLASLTKTASELPVSPPPPRPIEREIKTPPHGRSSDPPVRVPQLTQTTQFSTPEKGPNLALIFGILTFIIVLVAGGIFYFNANTARNSTGNGNNAGVSTNGSFTSTAGTGSNSVVGGKDCKKIGVLLPDTASSARWDIVDKPNLIKDIQNALPGATVDYSNANGNATTQQNQADADLTKGDCILIVAAADSVAASAIVQSATSRNVPVIAYDRLIQSNNLAFYVSFNNTQVGELQGQYIVDHYKDFTSGNNNLVMINGSQTDNNAILFHDGAHSALDPLISANTLKKVYETYTPNWDNDTARTEMDQALTANSNNIAIAYVANDGMANSVIAALKAQQLNGKVLVTGQDATIAGLHNILVGDQAMTVYKPIAKEANVTSQLVAAISKGIDTAALTNGQTTKNSNGTAIPSVLETSVAVDKTNISSTVLAMVL